MELVPGTYFSVLYFREESGIKYLHGALIGWQLSQCLSANMHAMEEYLWRNKVDNALGRQYACMIRFHYDNIIKDIRDYMKVFSGCGEIASR